ncbi:MAG: CBS domain-containing protein [Aquihabitans sp.]
MHVSVVLQDKGSEVITVGPQMILADVVALLHRHRIGAVIVSSDGQHIEGVLTERDVIRVLADEGPSALQRPTREVMTSEVFTCHPDSTVEALMSVMTERRFRHVPVVLDGVLAGVVSIGDVVKSRISMLENETQVLHEYIHNPY